MINQILRVLPRRFSLRLLFGMVLVFASVIAIETHRERQRQAVVNAIIDLGGETGQSGTTWHSPFPTRQITSVTIPYLSMDRVSDDDLSLLVNLQEVFVPDVQSPCPGELKQNRKHCVVPMVLKLPLAIPVQKKDLLAKIRAREQGLTLEELRLTYRE